MKKLLTVLLSFMLAASLIPAPALAEVMEEMGEVTQGGGAPAQTTQPAPTQGQGQPATQSQGEGAMGEDAQSGEGQLGEGQTGQQSAAPAEQQPSDPVLAVQEEAGPKSIWLEQYEKYDNDDPGHWQENYTVNPMNRFRIRASDQANAGQYSENTYDWPNATGTILFVSTTDTSKQYPVILKSDKTKIDGLFYQSDGMALPLPAGEYTITFMIDETTEHSTANYSMKGQYTVGVGDGHVFKGYYETGATGAFIRDSLSVKAAGTTQELDLVGLNTSVDLKLTSST